MITGGRIDEVEGKKMKEDQIKGLNINIELNDVKIADGSRKENKRIEIEYTYTATYAENLGHLKIKGVLFDEDSAAFAKDVETEWKKSKKLPDTYAENILNAINYSGSANGTLIARVLNISPPLIPPRIQLAKK